MSLFLHYPGSQLTGIFDSAEDRADSEAASCSTQARAKIAPIDANIADVRDNWKPTGFYTPDQLGQALGFIMQMTDPIDESIGRALTGQLNLPGHVDQLIDAINALHKAVGIGGVAVGGATPPLLGPDPLAPFSAAVSNARDQAAATGKDVVIEAQGFKRIVLNVLDAVREATGQLAFIECMRPSTFFAVLAKVNGIVQAFVGLLKTIGQVIKTAANIVLKIPDVIGSLLTFVKFLPWVALAFAGYYVGVKTELIPQKYDPMKLRERETFKPWRRVGK